MRRLLLSLVLVAVVATCHGAAVQIDFLASGLTDSSGNPLSGGLVYAYAAGTTNAKDTYTSPTMATAHPNPIVLDTYGRALAFGSGRYKFIIKTATGTTLYTWDGLTYANTTFVSGASVVQTSAAGQTTINLGAAYTSVTDKPYLYIGGIKQAENTYTWSPPTITLTDGAIPIAGITIEAGY